MSSRLVNGQKRKVYSDDSGGGGKGEGGEGGEGEMEGSTSGNDSSSGITSGNRTQPADVCESEEEIKQFECNECC